jgi:hypothetical protein
VRTGREAEMAQGPGKYDAEATRVRKRTGADAVAVMVIAGKEGHGFAVQMDPAMGKAGILLIAEALECTARQIRADLAEMEGH